MVVSDKSTGFISCPDLAMHPLVVFSRHHFDMIHFNAKSVEALVVQFHTVRGFAVMKFINGSMRRFLYFIYSHPAVAVRLNVPRPKYAIPLNPTIAFDAIGNRTIAIFAKWSQRQTDALHFVMRRAKAFLGHFPITTIVNAHGVSS